MFEIDKIILFKKLIVIYISKLILNYEPGLIVKT